MVNDGVVNARKACAFRAHFCEIFRVSGRIPRFQNPFKYIRRFDLNHETVHSALGAAHRDELYLYIINDLLVP